MAKRKRKAGEGKGFQLRIEPDYRSERFVMYVMNVETGILQAGKIDPELTDGDVLNALEDLIQQLQQSEALPRLLSDLSEMSAESPIDSEDSNQFVQYFVLMNLQHAFEQQGSLDAKDVIGIFEVIKTSVKRWSVGLHRRGYLSYIEDFLGNAGIRVQALTDDEAKALGLPTD